MMGELCSKDTVSSVTHQLLTTAIMSHAIIYMVLIDQVWGMILKTCGLIVILYKLC